jgi:hypothetical protein
MKRFYLIAVLLSLCAVGTQAQTQTPERIFTEGPVWRINYYKIKPGKLTDHQKWLREYRMRILDEQKRAGLVTDYRFFTQPAFDGPNDWDIMEAVQYKNYSDLLDYSADRSKKAEDIGLKVFGSAENRTKIWAELRDASRDVIASRIVREMQIKPMN